MLLNCILRIVFLLALYVLFLFYFYLYIFFGGVYYYDSIVSGHVTFDHLHEGIKRGISVLFICLIKSLRARNVTRYVIVF